MTRTARAAYPRAVNKDRSESRSGLDNTVRKSGAGQHNWGSLADEQELESAAMDDEVRETGMASDDAFTRTTGAVGIETIPGETNKYKPVLQRTSPPLSDEELEKARKYRKNALKKQGDIDLGEIARTSSAVAGASPAHNGPIRRMSNDNKMIHASDATVPSV